MTICASTKHHFNSVSIMYKAIKHICYLHHLDTVTDAEDQELTQTLEIHIQY